MKFKKCKQTTTGEHLWKLPVNDGYSDKTREKETIINENQKRVDVYRTIYPYCTECDIKDLTRPSTSLMESDVVWTGPERGVDDRRNFFSKLFGESESYIDNETGKRVVNDLGSAGDWFGG